MLVFKNRGGIRSWCSGFAIIILNVILKAMISGIKHIKERRPLKREKIYYTLSLSIRKIFL